MQLPATKVTGHYRIRTFVVSGVCSRKKESFTFVESFDVTTCKNLLRLSVLKHEQAMSMALKIMQLADDIFLQAVRTIRPGLRPVAIDVRFIITNDNLDDVLLTVLLLRILWQRTLHVSRETAGHSGQARSLSSSILSSFSSSSSLG